jgi:uncharacterized protein (TIGR00369 family)
MESTAAARVRSIFDKANFVRELGIELTEVGDNWCEATLKLQERHRQQHGFVHAGVIATLADHTGGGAARIASGERDVITIEFKINFLRPADGDKLLCRGRLLRAGKSVIVTEAEVFSISDAEQRLVAKLTQTLAVIG